MRLQWHVIVFGQKSALEQLCQVRYNVLRIATRVFSPVRVQVYNAQLANLQYQSLIALSVPNYHAKPISNNIFIMTPTMKQQVGLSILRENTNVYIWLRYPPTRLPLNSGIISSLVSLHANMGYSLIQL